MSAALLTKLIEAGTPAALVAEVAMELGRAQAASQLLEQRRSKDRQRKRVPRKSVESEESAETHPSPKENIKPPGSEANASGASPPADPMKQLFDVGVSILTATGKTETQARSLVGKWRKEQGEAKVLAAFLECRGKTISNPVEWLQRRLKSAKWVSKSGYEYRGDDESVLREAEKRNDMDTFWRVKASLKQAA